MAENVEKGPSDPNEINPKVASDVAYWSKEFGVTGEALHEGGCGVHGTHVVKVRAALAAHPHAGAHHDKKGA